MDTICHLKICTVNIGGFSPNSIMCLDKYNDENKFDIIKVQETGIRHDVDLCNMKYIKDDNKARGRVTMIYVKNDHSITKLKSLNQLSEQIDTTWGLAIIQGKRYIVASVYLKHKYIQGLKDLNNILKQAY